MSACQKFEVRYFGCEESRAMTDISADVNWHQSEEEITEIIRRSGKFLRGVFLQDRLVGTAAGYAYPDGGFAFINEVIVDSRFRRQGVGRLLMQELIPLVAAEYPVLRLYATDMGRPLYEQFDFKPYAVLSFLQLKPGKSIPDGVIVPFTADDLAEAAGLDMDNFGADRSGLIRSLMMKSPENAWVVKKDGRVTGFTVRGPMCQLLQAHDLNDMVSLIRHADENSGNGSFPVLIHQEHAEQLAGKCDVHFLLTAMQRGAGEVPRVTFSSMLPDIG